MKTGFSPGGRAWVPELYRLLKNGLEVETAA
jgi:hypothetical protein